MATTIRSCIHCGAEYIPKYETKRGKFCSLKCGYNHRYAQKRESEYARIRGWREANPERWATIRRRAHLKRHYGISLEEWDALADSQDGKCAICGVDLEGSSRVAVDHDHETGAIRGLLCHVCNLGIGGLKDDPNLLRKAIAYLERNEAPVD